MCCSVDARWWRVAQPQEQHRKSQVKVHKDTKCPPFLYDKPPDLGLEFEEDLREGKELDRERDRHCDGLPYLSHDCYRQWVDEVKSKLDFIEE